MAKRSGQAGKRVATLAVAWFFAVEALLLAFAAGSQAMPVRHDRFGDPICAAGTVGAAGERAPAPDRHQTCVLGCSMLGGTGAARSPAVLHPLRCAWPGVAVPAPEAAADASVPPSQRLARAPPPAAA